jgi:lipopolysaccharide O-acetyltransferase
LLFGNDVQINDYVHISAMERVVIGNNVLMASHIYISDNSHGAYKGDSQSTPDIPPIKRDYYVAPVQIEDNVWIGEGVIIMPGVSVGHGSVIGANSVVTKNIPADSIAVGNPAKVIKTFDTLQSQWIATASRNIL